jgi:hypothetical protein
MIEISDQKMTLTVCDAVIATARFSQHAAADGNGAWIVSTYPARLFTRNQAITALVLAEHLAVGYDHTDPFVDGWRAELSLPNDATEDAKRAHSVHQEQRE